MSIPHTGGVVILAAQRVSSNVPKKQLLVVSLPSGQHASYYRNQLDGSLRPFVRMFTEYSQQAAAGGDDFMVVYSQDAEHLLIEFKVHFHQNTLFLLVDDPLDVWMRDFSSTFVDSQIKFL